MLTDRTGRPLLQGALFFTPRVQGPQPARGRTPQEGVRVLRADARSGVRPGRPDASTHAQDRRQLPGQRHAAARRRPAAGGPLRLQHRGRRAVRRHHPQERPLRRRRRGNQIRRHLAIILDGLVMSAPTINSRNPHPRPDQRQLHQQGSRRPGQHPPRRAAAGHAQAAAGQREHHRPDARRRTPSDAGVIADRAGVPRPCWPSWSSTTASPAWSPASPCWPTCC